MLSVKIWRPDTGATGYITKLDLSPLSTKYRVTNIDGIDYVDSNILSDKVSQHYGSIYRGWSVADREITIDIVPIGDIQTNRRELLSFFNTRGIYRIELIDGVHDIADPLDLPELSLAWINGYVRAIDYQNFAKQESIKLIFVCPYPYFTRLNGQYSAALALNVLFGIDDPEKRPLFPMGLSVRSGMIGIFGASSDLRGTIVYELDNVGTIEVGLVFAVQILVRGYIQIDNLVTVSLDPGIYFIDARPTMKSAFKYEYGVLTSINNAFLRNTTWPKIKPGHNSVEVSVPVPADGDQRTYALLSYAPEYEGI